MKRKYFLSAQRGQQTKDFEDMKDGRAHSDKAKFKVKRFF